MSVLFLSGAIIGKYLDKLSRNSTLIQPSNFALSLANIAIPMLFSNFGVISK